MRIYNNADKFIELLLDSDFFKKQAAHKKKINAYPYGIFVTCETIDIYGAFTLAKALKRHQKSILSSSLFKLKTHYMCLKLRTKDLEKVLPDICEHSNRVFIGSDYLGIIREHGETLIQSKAAEALECAAQNG